MVSLDVVFTLKSYSLLLGTTVDGRGKVFLLILETGL